MTGVTKLFHPARGLFCLLSLTRILEGAGGQEVVDCSLAFLPILDLKCCWLKRSKAPGKVITVLPQTYPYNGGVLRSLSWVWGAGH